MATFIGDNLNNTIVGTTANDTLSGLGGNDTIRGGGGSDHIDGGSGIDTVDGSGAGGQIYVDLGNNFYGSDGYFVSYTGLYSYLDSIENFIGGRYTDDLLGNAAANTLTGNGGDDSIVGNAGNDRLYGGSGIDSIRGGDGNDSVVGGQGADLLEGDNGRDSFRFAAGETGVGAAADTIQDFSHTQGDRIDLAAIDAKVTVAGNQAFAFVYQANFTANHPGTVNYKFAGADAVVSYNTDNDAAAEGQIVLHGVHANLVAGDFIL